MAPKTFQRDTMKRGGRGLTAAVIAVVIALILGASFLIMDIMERRAHSAAERLVSEVVERIDTKVSEVEAATRVAAQEAFAQLRSPQALEQLTRTFIEENPSVYGSTVAFEPYVFPSLGRCYAPYSWRSPDDGEVHTRQLGTETDYYEEEWYAQTKLTRSEYWCEPYFDEGGAKTMMCTFSVPIMSSSNGRLTAVMTADVGLADLQDYITSIRPNPESRIILRSQKGAPLTDVELSGHNDDIIIKGMAEIGWTVELMMPFNYLMHGDSGIVLILGLILLITALLVYLFNRIVSKLQQRASAEYLKVIGAFTQDFVCVDYVELTDDRDSDIAISYRASESLHKRIPAWADEQYFTKKLDLISDNLVYQPDREQFRKDTRRELILSQLEHADSHYVNFRLIGNDGRIKYYQMQISAVRDGDKLTGIVAGLRSIDEQMRKEKQQQAALEEALTRAESASKAKTDFLFNMSHDIRTPMNAITGFTSMARTRLDDPAKVSDYLQKIDISSQQLLMLINQVLEMSRIESGKVELDLKPTNVRQSFAALATVLAAQARSHGLEFHSSLEDIVHEHVLADETRMSQITLNITSNAIKYTLGGSIDYRLRENPCEREGFASYTFTVIDTGIGMSEEFLKVIFEPFSRENTSTVSRIQGTGLGLSIVKSLVDLLGGTIEVQSELGHGTRFDVTVEFQLCDETATYSPAEQAHTDRDFAGRRILLVEDNALNREIARFILEGLGIDVEEAEDGDVAVAMAQAIADRGEYHYYDMILMDIQMPRMDGYEATRLIREIAAPEGIHIPIVALSANAFEEDRVKSLNAGMDAHIAKPIDIGELTSTLSRFLC